MGLGMPRDLPWYRTRRIYTYIAYRCIVVKADESSQLDFAHDISAMRPCKQEVLNESALSTSAYELLCLSVSTGVDSYQYKRICNYSLLGTFQYGDVNLRKSPCYLSGSFKTHDDMRIKIMRLDARIFRHNQIYL